MNLNAYGPLQEKLKNKKYRQAFVASSVRHHIALQIRALRKRFFSTQRALGDAVNKPANVISRLEDPSYGKVSVSTLLELANAFDVALVVKFVPFGDAAEYADQLDERTLLVPPFEEELAEQFAIDVLARASSAQEAISQHLAGSSSAAQQLVAAGELQPMRVGSFFGSGCLDRSRAECVAL